MRQIMSTDSEALAQQKQRYHDLIRENRAETPMTPREHTLTINGKPASKRAYNRIMNAKPRSTDKDPEPQGSRPFSLLR